LDERTDAELVVLAQAGDRDAFSQLIERCQGMASRIALRMVGHEALARELAHEAIVQAYLSLGQLRDAERFRSWLYGITLNVCRGYLRDRRRAVSLEALAGGLQFDAIPFTGLEPDPQERAEAQELHRLVGQAVEGLSPENRAVTLLFYYEELSQREIAAILGISVAAVKGRLHRSRMQLRQRLWPVYGVAKQIVVPAPRRTSMIPVTIADVVTSKHFAEDQEREMHVVILYDEAGQRVLPIWIGPYEADAIRIRLREIPVARPLTYSFMATMLAATGVSLEEVRIQVIKDDTFYAMVRLRQGQAVHEVDARPSDAINLALITESPILVAEELMARQGIPVPEGKTLQMHKALTAEQSRMEQEMEAQRSRPQPGEEERRQRTERNLSLLVAYLLGEEE
jgi:RNA polymerase sigma factor (sigma-70 family)